MNLQDLFEFPEKETPLNRKFARIEYINGTTFELSYEKIWIEDGRLVFWEKLSIPMEVILNQIKRVDFPTL